MGGMSVQSTLPVAVADVKCGWRFVQKGQEVDNLIKKLSCRWVGHGVGHSWLVDARQVSNSMHATNSSCLCRGYREKALYKSLVKRKDHIQEPSGDHAIERLAGEGGARLMAITCTWPILLGVAVCTESTVLQCGDALVHVSRGHTEHGPPQPAQGGQRRGQPRTCLAIEPTSGGLRPSWGVASAAARGPEGSEEHC